MFARRTKMQQQKTVNEELCDEYEFEEPYNFSPSITKKRTVNGKTYTVRSYYVGGKDFNETVQRLAEKQAYKNVG